MRSGLRGASLTGVASSGGTDTRESLAEGARLAIVGGGIAGLETLMAVRDLAEDRLAITLISPDPEFLYKPLVVEEPFSPAPAERRALGPIAEEFGADLVQRAVSDVRADRHELVLSDGETLGYDAAVVCVGGRARRAFRRAISFEVTPEPLEMDRILTEAAQGEPRRVAFVVPPGVTWSLPLYELALLSRRRAQELGLDDLELLDAAGIAFAGSTYADVESARQVWLRPSGQALEVDRVLALPVLVGPAPPGLPADERGFIPADVHGRVPGADDVYAAGDGTQFPVKQGGIATQQADLVAADIAKRVGVKVEPVEHFRPVLRAKLMTGAKERFLRGDEATGGRGASSESSDHALWWPPGKIAGAYLAPYLAGPEAVPPEDREGLEIELPLEMRPSGER